MDYDKFERWSQVWLEASTSPPPDGYKKVSIEQVHHADMEPHEGAQKWRPALAKGLAAPEIRLHLQPLQGASGSNKRGVDDDFEPGKKAKTSPSRQDDEADPAPRRAASEPS